MSESIHQDLDRPIWSALTSRQSHLGHGDRLARRFVPDVAPFAAVTEASDDAFKALRQLLEPEEQVALLSLEPIGEHEGLQVTRVGTLHQMISVRPETSVHDVSDVIRLSHADAQDMLDLTQKTKPGPFARRTHEMGNYIGVRDGGRLIAMAGERLHLNGYVEISAVCVDDDWRGKGLAGRLMNILRRDIERRGETPFLHVFAENMGAIGLYERLGFELRRVFHLSRVNAA